MFEHTNVGDEILVIKEIRIGYGCGVRYAVKHKVIRTTKTQIIISENERYRRDNGKLVGGSYSFGPDAFLQGYDLSDAFQKAPEILTIEEFNRLNAMTRRFRSVVEIFFPKLESSHIAAMFREPKLRDAIDNAAQDLSDIIKGSAIKVGVGHILDK